MTEVLTDQNVIETQLQKQNITDGVIKKLQDDYMPLKINGIADKAGYRTVDEARKNCKAIRVMATKVCKEGREEALQVQKAWIAKEKEVTGKISVVEDYLEGEISRIDAEKEQVRLEAERREQLRVQARVAELIDNGCAFDGIFYSIDDIKISSESIRFIDDANWADGIVKIQEAHAIELEMAAAEAQRVENERIEQERIRKEEEERIVKERAELEQMRKEQAEREATIKAEQNRIAAEQEAKDRALMERQQAIEKAENEAKQARIREEEERQRTIKHMQEIEDAKEAARLQAIEDERREQERIEREKEAARIEEERQAALRPDKEKLISFSEMINGIALPHVESEAAKKLVDDVRVMIGKMQSHILIKVKSL